MSTDKQKCIGIIEDDVGCQFVYRDILSPSYKLVFYSSLSDFRAHFLNPDHKKPHLLIADIRLNDGMVTDLFNLEFWQRISFIVVSVMDDGDLLRLCYEKGAIDYLTKPFNRNELLIKIERSMEKIDRSDGAEHGFAEVQLDPYQMVAIRGQQVSEELTQKEYQILSLLIKSPHQQLTREAIYQPLWGSSRLSSKTLDVHLSNLRKKISGLSVTIVFENSVFRVKELPDPR